VIVILCIDDNLGMMFNHRRQSKDRFLLDDVIGYIREQTLYMDGYSYTMFSNLGSESLIVDHKFLDKAAKGEYCFVEDRFLIPYVKRIEKLIIYKWNRRYPADLYLDLSLGDGWKMIGTKELKGSSHEKITKEIYTR
jgi:hypothetical protein